MLTSSMDAPALLSSAPVLSTSAQPISSSLPPDDEADQSSITQVVPAADKQVARAGLIPTRDLWKHPGIGLKVGVNGPGFEIAEPLGMHFNIRAGGEYMQYTGNFTEQGAAINAAVKVGGGAVSLDYFPWHNGFHISGGVRFANQTKLNGTVVVPGGETITLDGTDYVASSTDPLHGDASITTRSVAPSVTIGYGNLAPRRLAKHFSFPVEVGFYYIGQPSLAVHFTGSACDPNVPAKFNGCENVSQDAGFQKDLAAFIARNNNNLSYAKFFPIISFGVGYRF